ncbi:hypothetical protein EDD21DRAFT_390854 [Dissophora ornata]|nr:hypothetical protein BGZ58_002132 [Dissophora ornata]KAI8595581.1 hypothetical protein EDD21DRAFT_390854 [Dissophora ornata]
MAPPSYGQASSPPPVTALGTNSAPLDSTKQTVPRPRPGELLIYDCRPIAPVSGSTHGDGTLITATQAAPSSPPTPTPDLENSSTFRGRTTATIATDSSPREKDAQAEVLLTSSDIESINEQGAMDPSVNLEAVSNSGLSRHGQGLQTHLNPQTRPIRLLQWNIERNYKSAEILATLTELDADILCIQEIDIGCHRSGHERDHFLEICRSQGLYGGFVPEFWELEHPGRKDRDQGGGVHGNAILSRWPVNGFRVLDHVHHAYEWEKDGLKLNEPRLGRRFTIVADIQTPSGPLLCYCAHLEVFTGIVGRISALSDILADSELYSDRYPYQILFGDLNTISHSIARLAKTISTDQYRVASVGLQEAEWWDNNLWSWHVQDGEFNLALATGGWTWLRRLGFLGIGTSRPSQGETDGPLWPADGRYSEWLKRLVGAGLDKVKQARQEQLMSDKFTSLDQGQRSAANSVELGELVSENGGREDGNMILVESSTVDRRECMILSSAPTRRHSTRNDGSSDEEEIQKYQRKMSSSPPTPSPTLRLIPPTPTRGRAGSNLSRDEDRGIPVRYEDSDEDDEDDNNNQRLYSIHGAAAPYNDHDQQYSNDLTNAKSKAANTTSRPRQNSDNNDNKNDTFKDPQPPFLLSTLKNTHPFFSTRRLWSGFTPLVLHQARNSGFYDPWSAREDLTLHNPNFFGLLKAKLDYTLLMNMNCVGRSTGNHDYSASDHKWLLVEVEFEREFNSRTNTAMRTIERTEAAQDSGLDNRTTTEKNAEEVAKSKKLVLPSKEQRYLWWRERRHEWGQSVQPLPPSLSTKHGGQKNEVHSSPYLSTTSLLTTMTAAVSVGLWWWTRRK